MPINPHRNRRGATICNPGFDHGRPIATLGIAPLAGVLLTIAIMLFATWPPTINAVTVDLPYLGPYAPPPDETMKVIRIGIGGDGAVTWNGHPVASDHLTRLLGTTKLLPRQPGIVFEPEGGAPYNATLHVLGAVERAGLIDNLFCFGDLRPFGVFGNPRAASPPEAMPCDPRRNAALFVD